MKKITLILLVIITVFGCKKDKSELTINKRSLDELPIVDIESQYTFWYNVSKPYLSVMSEPAQDSDEIDQIPFAARVHILKFINMDETIDDLKGRWFYVKYSDIIGWAFSAHFKSIEDLVEDATIELSDYKLTEHKVITITLSIPHGPYLSIRNPDGHFYYVICPQEECEKYSPYKYKEFSTISIFTIDTETFTAEKAVYGAGRERVFSKNGKYIIMVGDNFASEFAVSIEAVLEIDIY